MRGHFLSGTRKLNRHYQSGNGWKLIGSGKHTWMIDQKVLNGGAVVGYIPYDGTPNNQHKIPLRVGTKFKIVSDLPIYRSDVDGTAEDITHLHQFTVGFANLEFEKNGMKYYVDGLSAFSALPPLTDAPIKVAITVSLDSLGNEPIIKFAYWCDETYKTVYVEVVKIFDGYSNLVCLSKFAIPDYRGNSIYFYLTYFSETEIPEYGIKMYVKG